MVLLLLALLVSMSGCKLFQPHPDRLAAEQEGQPRFDAPAPSWVKAVIVIAVILLGGGTIDWAVNGKKRAKGDKSLYAHTLRPFVQLIWWAIYIIVALAINGACLYAGLWLLCKLIDWVF